MKHLHTPSKRSLRACAAALLTVGVLTACSHKKLDQPAKLAPIKSTLRVHTLWTASVGGFHPFGLWEGQTPHLLLGLGLAREGNRLFAAGHNGEIAAFNVRTGHELWSVDAHAPLGGGPAVHGNLLVVGATNGEVVAFNATNGRQLWRVRLHAAVISPPAVATKLIAVRTIDDVLHALSPKNGHELWEKTQNMPSLSLRGAAVPVIADGMVISGFATGKVLAVGAASGSTRWLATISAPSGNTAIARLADLDGPVAVAGHKVYAVGYHGTVTMLSLKNGHTWWTHKASSFRGVTLGRHALYITMADGAVEALNRKNGALIWRQPALRYRGLTRPAVSRYGVIVADYQGYVSWMNKRTGAFAARRGTGGVRVSNPPIVVGNEVIVINDIGDITAFRVAPK